MKLSALVLAFLLVFIGHAFADDSITLKDGEVVQGEIVSENESQVVFKVMNASHTIASKRIVSTSDIKGYQRETPEQKQDRYSYEALRQLQLDPNHELSKADYTRGIEAFDKHLKTYPDSKYADEARQRMTAWKDELSHLEKGEVKFAGRWMTPEEKKPLWDRYVKEQRVAQAAAYLQSVRQSLNKQESQRVQTVGEIARCETAIPSYQDQINQYNINPPGHREAVYETRPGQVVGGQSYWDPQTRSYRQTTSTQGLPQRVYVGDRWVRDQGPIDKAISDLANAQTQLAQKRQELITLDGSISAMRQSVAQAESAYQMANAALQQ